MPYPNVLQHRETAEDKLLVTSPAFGELTEPTVRSAHDIWLAACDGDVPSLRTCLKLGADINALGQPDPPYGPPFCHRTLFRAPPLCYAAGYGREKAIASLLADGADVNRRSSTGFTAREYAQHRGYHVIVRMLMEAEQKQQLQQQQQQQQEEGAV